MNRPRTDFLFFSLLFFFCLPGFLAGQEPSNGKNGNGNWFHFRGVDGSGKSENATPPISWSNSRNIRWKLPIPGKGSGSPIVCGDRIFVVTSTSTSLNQSISNENPLTQSQVAEKFDANKDGQLDQGEQQLAREYMQEQRNKLLPVQQFHLICVNRFTGDIEWSQLVATAKPPEGHHEHHGFASSSPATDGEFVFSLFPAAGLYCHDFSGQLVWKREDLGKMTTRGNFGAGSSISVSQDLIVLPWDHEGESRIEVINKLDGRTIWKQNRDEPSNWCTPLFAQWKGKDLVIQSGQNFCRGYDATDGTELWRTPGLTQRPVATPICRDGIAWFASGRGGFSLLAVPIGSSGDVQPLWEYKTHAPDVPSMAMSDHRIFFLSGSKGILCCLNANTGEPLFEPQRLPGISEVYSSIVIADGKVFITGRNGNTVVIRDQDSFEIMGRNQLGEPVDSTLALVDGNIIIRSESSLYCIESSPNQ